MAQEGEEKNTQTTPSVRDPVSSDSTTTLAPAQASGEDTTASETGEQSQPETSDVPGRDVVFSLGVIDEHSFTRECITKSLHQIGNFLNITSFATCDECLKSRRNYDLILYHAHESVASSNDNHERLAAVRKVLRIAPVIILCGVDCFDSIAAAFESGARGYIPTANTTLELAIEIMRLVKAGGTFVPPSSLSLGRVTRHSETAGATAQGTLVPSSGLPLGRITRHGEAAGAIATRQFTPRQMAVLEYLKLGKTNKTIAHELGISESTVKVHLRIIMRKMKATNRTEAACLALTPWQQEEG
jgi:DNA-binding NarL/FixJ family response regulator